MSDRTQEMGTCMQPLMVMDAEPNGRPSRDALPEQLEWRDSGCEVAPRCLECPLPRCRYDDPGGLRGLLNESRNAAMLQAHAAGRTADEIARRFGVSRRSVFRILRQQRSGGTCRANEVARAPRTPAGSTDRRER